MVDGSEILHQLRLVVYPRFSYGFIDSRWCKISAINIHQQYVQIQKFDHWLLRTTLPETNIAHENPPFWWYLPGEMGIFMGYVSFREGKPVADSHFDP